jgi:hypothetical protein
MTQALAQLHLWDRLAWAARGLAPVQTSLRVAYEDPAQPDAPVKILIPAPEWLACARHGGILPPIETYLDMPLELELADGDKLPCTYVEAQDLRLVKDVVGERVLPHHTLHSSTPIGPMTDEQALEYLIMKDIPRRVWGRKHNRPMFKVITVDQLPKSRVHRNAWRLETFA